MAAKLLTSQLLLKLELMPNETCKTSRLKIVAKTLMNLSSSLIKVKYSSDIIKSMKRQISKSNISETAANFEK